MAKAEPRKAATQRPRREAGRDPEKRQQILEGAYRVFMRMGFDAASMNDITREAGVSKGTIYVYFAGKDELFAALVEEQRDNFTAGLETPLTGASTPREALTEFGRRLAQLTTRSEVVRAQRIVIAIGERKPELARAFFATGYLATLDMLTAWLERRPAAQRKAMPDCRRAAIQFVDLCAGQLLRERLYMERGPATARDIDASVLPAVDLFCRAYGL